MKTGTLVHNNKLGPGIVTKINERSRLACVWWLKQQAQVTIRPRHFQDWKNMFKIWSAGSYGDVTIESLPEKEEK